MQTGGRCGGLLFLCPKDARNTHRKIIVQTDPGRQNTARGGDPVKKLITRLIDCGMPREIAVCMMRQYRGRPHEFELYVESVEAECHEPMEEI